MLEFNTHASTTDICAQAISALANTDDAITTLTQLGDLLTYLSTTQQPHANDGISLLDSYVLLCAEVHSLYYILQQCLGKRKRTPSLVRLARLINTPERNTEFVHVISTA